MSRLGQTLLTLTTLTVVVPVPAQTNEPQSKVNLPAQPRNYSPNVDVKIPTRVFWGDTTRPIQRMPGW